MSGVKEENGGCVQTHTSLRGFRTRTDEGRGRDILYKLFIKKQFPNSEPYKGVSGSVRLILLNR